MKIRLFITFLLITLAPITSFGQIKLEDLKIDTSLTGFHYAANFQGTIIYTKNGSPDINTINPSAFSFTIAPNISFEDAKEEIRHLLKMSLENNFTISELVEEDTTLDSKRFYSIGYTETTEKNKYKNFVFNAIVQKGNTIIIFASGDLDNGIYIEKFKKTFFSIKL